MTNYDHIQDRQGGSDRSYRGNDHHSKSDRSYRNTTPPKRSRGDRGNTGYRSNDNRQRNMSPPPSRRNDFKPASTGIKSRLAPIRSRVTNTVTSRINRPGGGKILRRNDNRGGMVAKRSATINRAKDYARKIRQARMKLNEGSSTSSTSKLKSTIESKSPRKDSVDRKNDDPEDDILAIANDVNFDEDENESTGGKATVKEESKAKEGNKEEDADLNENAQAEKGKKADAEPSKVDKDEKSAKDSVSRSPSKERVRKFENIEYSCIHCGKQSTSAHVSRQQSSPELSILIFPKITPLRHTVCI